MLGDFVEVSLDKKSIPSIAMIIGLAKNAPNLKERIFKTLIVGGTGSGKIKDCPYNTLIRKIDEQQENCKTNYSAILLGYTEWKD